MKRQCWKDETLLEEKQKCVPIRNFICRRDKVGRVGYLREPWKLRCLLETLLLADVYLWRYPFWVANRCFSAATPLCVQGQCLLPRQPRNCVHRRHHLQSRLPSMAESK